MKLNSEKFRSGATRGDVAGVAIKTVLIARSTVEAFRKLRDGEDIRALLVKIEAEIEDLTEQFDDLVGWVEPDGD